MRPSIATISIYSVFQKRFQKGKVIVVVTTCFSFAISSHSRDFIIEPEVSQKAFFPSSKCCVDTHNLKHLYKPRNEKRHIKDEWETGDTCRSRTCCERKKKGAEKEIFNERSKCCFVWKGECNTEFPSNYTYLLDKGRDEKKEKNAPNEGNEKKAATLIAV